MYSGPPFADRVNPTHDEIRAWAYSGADEPMQDWDLVVAEPANLGLLVDLVGDTACPGRDYLLRCLYCTVGHSDRSDPRVRDAATRAASSPDRRLATWGREVGRVLARPRTFHRDDWCGWQG